MNEPRKKFDMAVRAVFDSNNPESHSLFVFVKRTLIQYRLSQTYEVYDIFTEAYSRGVKLTDAGQPIHVPIAWFRRTSLNIIREFRRQQDRLSIPRLDLTESSPLDALSDLVFQEDLIAIKLAYEQLDAENQLLLHERIVQGQSWRDVGKVLVARGASELSEGALRQRGFKALRELRRCYEAIRPDLRIDLLDQRDIDFFTD